MNRAGRERFQAMQDFFEMKANFNTVKSHRISGTLRYLKRNNLTLANRFRGAQSPERLVTFINQAVQSSGVSSIISYTDGSTNPKSNSANSGCGIVITDQSHQIIWSGGMKVRADGNNFIPEVGAISCMIKALPPDISMTLRSDSLAAIGAISKGRVSERRRVRAPGRSWLNFCREELLQKRASINLEHVSSHKGLQSPEQIGNDLADKLANCFRILGDGIPPVKYFMSAEEPFVLVHNGKVVQGDPRLYLKKVSCDRMMTIVCERYRKNKVNGSRDIQNKF